MEQTPPSLGTGAGSDMACPGWNVYTCNQDSNPDPEPMVFFSLLQLPLHFVAGILWVTQLNCRVLASAFGVPFRPTPFYPLWT